MASKRKNPCACAKTKPRKRNAPRERRPTLGTRLKELAATRTGTERKLLLDAAAALERPNPGEHPGVAKARRDYVKTHWGLRGRGKVQRLGAPNPAIPCAELGVLESITYETRKAGDDGLVHYVHRFLNPRPRLAFNESGLLILGGGYTVTERGIER